MIVPQTLYSLRNLFKICKEYDIVPMDECYDIFHMQLDVVVIFDKYSFIKIAAKFYGESMNEYPVKNDYFLGKSRSINYIYLN